MHQWDQDYGYCKPIADELFDYTENTRRVRRFIMDTFIKSGPGHSIGPDVHTIKKELGLTQEELWHSLDQLHRGCQVSSVPGTEINLNRVPPFSYNATRHRVTREDGKWYWSNCGSESVASQNLWKGQSISIRSLCPCCWEEINHSWKDGKLLSCDSPGALLHIGKHLDDWAENFAFTCDHINFFKDKSHIETWEKQFPDKAGATLPLPDVWTWVIPEATARYHNYYQGPGIVGRSSHMAVTVEGFKKSGFDVSKWEKKKAA